MATARMNVIQLSEDEEGYVGELFPYADSKNRGTEDDSRLVQRGREVWRVYMLGGREVEEFVCTKRNMLHERVEV